MIGNDFLYWLQNEGYGTIGVNIFYNFKQDKPDNCIVVYDINSPVIDESSSLSIDQFCVQVIVRNTSEESSRLMTKNIHENFIGFGGEPLKAGSNVVSMSFVDTSPHSIGKDEEGRHEWAVSYRMRVQSENNKYRL
jgi:hypothetical protein